MNFAGPAAELEIVETTDSLVFRSVPRTTWADILQITVICLGIAVYFRHHGVWVYAIAIAGLACWIIYGIKCSRPSELWMTETKFTSSQSGSGAWPEFYNITFHYGDPEANKPSGLYGIRWMGAVCLLPSLDEEQTLRVIETIYTRFPKLPLSDPPKEISFFEKRNELITLGLSKPSE